MTHPQRLLAMLKLLLLAALLPLNASAETIRMTQYADGKSCPGDCDAHVVYDRGLDGTDFAHLPNTATNNCIIGKDCEICLESGRKQCLVVTYRGRGPSEKTFDLTPAFFDSRCKMADIPALLKSKCDSLQKQAAALNGRINCIKDLEHESCKPMMTAARERQLEDLKIYDKCKAMTQAKFNATKKTAAEKRQDDCAYEFKGTGGPNSRGVTWRKLLPGACRPNTFVGRDGLDCCSGAPSADGPLGSECKAFYPLPSKSN